LEYAGTIPQAGEQQNVELDDSTGIPDCIQQSRLKKYLKTISGK
jgi:hypothetical protein